MPLPPVPSRGPPRHDTPKLAVAVLVSALFHVVIVILLVLGEFVIPVLPQPAAETPTPDDLVLLRLVEEIPGVPRPPVPTPARVQPAPPGGVAPPAPDGPAGAAPGATGGGVTVGPEPGAGAGPLAPRGSAQRLRPGTPDMRLWTLDPKATAFTPEQLARMHLAWAILDLNDSTASALARESRVADWTFTDENGKRWGIANGKLHLGDFAVPLPFSFSPPPGSAAAERAWVDAEIDRAAGGARARANLGERIRAIRERLEVERRRLQSDSSRVRPPGP